MISPSDPAARILLRVPVGRDQSVHLIRLERVDWRGLLVCYVQDGPPEPADRSLLSAILLTVNPDDVLVLDRPLRLRMIRVLVALHEVWLFLVALPFVVAAALVFGTALGRGCPIPPPEWLR